MREVGALLEAKALHPKRSARNHLRWLAQAGCPARAGGWTRCSTWSASPTSPTAGPASYSLGMSQRLGIAAALLGDPGILILDEPVNGLDPEGIHWIRTLLQALAAEGRTVLLSSHLMSEMEQTAQHVLVIGRGRLLADMPMAEFTRQAGGGTHPRRVPRLRAAGPAAARGRRLGQRHGDQLGSRSRAPRPTRSATSPPSTACGCTS